MSTVLAIDVGGTGARLRLAPARSEEPAGPDDVRTLTADGARVGRTGSDVAALVVDLVRRARDRWPADPPAAVGVGATGLASLVDDHDGLLRDLVAASGCARVAVAADAVTAHLGALGGEPGAVIAVGTGAIALGTDLDRRWIRVGGWGHLYDDRGSGAWIGIAALQAAIRAHDGVGGAGRALLDAATDRLGAPPTWTRLLTLDDRAGVLASLAPDVVALADAGDPAASGIVHRAGQLAAESLAAALVDGIPRVAAATGGLTAAPRYADALAAEFARLAPDADLRPSRGAPLGGAVELARRAAAGRAPATLPGLLWSTAPAAGR